MASSSSGLWAPFKEILHTVECAVRHKRSEVYAELDESLTKYKPIFISLLKNPAKNATHREQVQKANRTELKIDGYLNGIKLQDSTIKDVLLLSDALNLNELSSLELILIAEKQLTDFPGFSTPLIASLLYHDGRRCLVSSLKMLLMARPGITWTLELDDRIVELIEKFVNQLLDDGLVAKILQLLEEISLPKELKKLEDAHSLKEGKHKKLITELVEEQQLLLADCLFVLACQFPLDKDSCTKLLNYLKLVAPNTSDGSLDPITLRVLLALLGSFNCDIIDVAVENIEDDQYQRLPYFKDKTFLIDLHKAISRPDLQVWQTAGIKYVIQFCWAICLRTCSAHPELVDFYGDVIEDDEAILEAAIEGGAMNYLRTAIIEANKFHDEEYFVKVIHSFITSFIVKFPLKVKDMRNRGDENARILEAHLAEGMEPPHGLKHDFQDFMELMKSLYSKDPAGLELSCEYWIPPEPLGGVFSPLPLKKYQQADNHKRLMLNKFLRLAGDILLQPLYVPYINMLAALSNNEQAASHCFQLLSMNGSMDSGGACSVTWDHFFMSLKQYYLSLRQTTDSSDHRAHLHRHQEISPEEQAGLESVLKLIKTVAEQNENVRVAFCENPTWLPVASLLGLVCCPVPPSMKGLLLDTLAAFSKTPEISAALWQSVEASQVLQTIPSTGASTAKSGIAIELQEIESRNETYPETIAFINLINRLTNIAVPPTLGAGHRVPGFEPYLDFLINDVFLKFKTRAYQDVSEKWKIACEVVRIYVKLLKDYDPQPDDFMDKQVEIQGVNFGRAAKSPGFQLMVQLLKDTPFLRMVLAVIDDVNLELTTLLTTSDLKSLLEDTTCLCLQLLECVFEKQEVFIEMAKSTTASLVLSPMEDLLLSVNQRTGLADYLCVLGSYLSINNISPMLTLSIVRLFKYVCGNTKSKREIVEIITQNETSSRELLVGFSEQLEIVDPEDESSVADTEQIVDDTIQENVTDMIRQNIVALMISTLQQPAPNMAQFLLGFEVRRPIQQTNLQDPGIGGFPKTCLHSVIEILNRGLHNMGSVPLTPKLSELLYRLIYMICAHEEMGPAVRRYLRANTDFFTTHCQALPFIRPENDLDELLYIRLANQQSWLLKTIAIELRVVAASRMRSGLQQLLALLYSDQAAVTLTSQTNTHDNTSLLETTMKKRETLSQTMFSSCFTFGNESENMILSLLNSLSFTQRYPPNVGLNFFDYSAIEQLVVSCEEIDEMGVGLCNVRKLFKTMMNEINSSQLAVSPAQKDEILKEVRFVLKHAVDRNLVRQSFHAKHNAFDALRQVVEVTFAVCPDDVVTAQKKQLILVDILQALLPMMNDEENLSELTSPICGTILSLMANLWLTFTQTDNSTMSPDAVNIMKSVSGLFADIVKAISKIAGAQPRVRANLYGAFLYFIQIGQMHSSIIKDAGVSSNIFDNQSKENWETNTFKDIDCYSDQIINIVTKDACQGPCITRMMAMSVLQAIISLDWKHKFLTLMSSHGYLRVFVDQLVDDDTELIDVLSVQPQSMKPLYLFESKMAFLSKIASSDFGAQALLQMGLISRLTECQFLDVRINEAPMISNSTMNYTNHNDPFMPSINERYTKIFTAFAKLMLALISSLGVQHQIVISQMQSLILSHEDTIKNILQDTSEVHSINSLKQLSLTIAIISVLPVADSKDDAWEILTDDQRHWRIFMNRVERNMGLLLQKYSAATIQQEKGTSQDVDFKNQQLQEILGVEQSNNVTIKQSPLNVAALESRNNLLQIRSRILTFCKNFVASRGLSGPFSRVLFAPILSAKSAHESRLITGRPVVSKQLPSLDVLIEELKQCPDDLKHCLENKKILQRKLEAVDDMSHEEIKEILSQEEDAERLPKHQRLVIVKRIFRKLLELREAEANYLTYIIEHVIYILWRHIDYYFNHCVTVDGDYLEDGALAKSFHSQRARKLTDSSYTSFIGRNSVVSQSPSKVDKSLLRGGKSLENTVTKEDITELKIEATGTLTDALWKKILESDQLHGRHLSRLSFSSALIRRLKGLVQLNT